MLGEGARKRVYEGRDQRLGRSVAIAHIKAESLDEGGRARIRREAHAMARLGDHPNIVTVHDVIEEDGQVFLVAPLLTGGDLATRIAAAPDKRLPIPDAARIGAEIAGALDYAHTHGVVHRDVKPGNVWFTADGTALLGDFGLALAANESRLTHEGSIVGTAAYLAPEQALGAEVTPRADLYSLGALLYEVICGRPPFAGDDAVAVIGQHLNAVPVAPSVYSPEIPGELDALIGELLAKDPARRPANAAVVRERLLRVARAPLAPAPLSVQKMSNPLDRLDSGVFVGRERELAQLHAAADAAAAGRGRVALLAGEPGIGKTRTAEELATYARLRSTRVLWGRCYEGAGAPAYWPWIQVLRATVEQSTADELRADLDLGASDLAEIVPEIRTKLGDVPSAPRLEPEQARFRLLQSLVAFLRRSSARRPLVLILDDLHWADEPSLLVLQFAIREIASMRLLVVATYRDVELGRQHPLEKTLAELVRADNTGRVLLRGLTEQDAARFVELTSGHRPPSDLVAAIYRETEGNPFFIHEVVRLLQSDGRLERAAEIRSWSHEIPQGIRQVIGRRLSALSESCNRVLGVASVLGRDFDARVLAAMCEMDAAAVDDALEEAERARLIGTQDDRRGLWRFSHAMVRETLYAEHRTTQRVRLHRRAGQILEQRRDAGANVAIAELANHFCEAASGGDVEKAVRYAADAASQAQSVYAFEEAANHLERALIALDARDTPDDARRVDLSIECAACYRRGGSYDRYLEAARRGYAIARGLGDDARLVAAAEELAQFPAYPIDPERRQEMSEALGGALLVAGSEDSPARARILSRMVGVHVWTSRPAEFRARAEEALAVARRSGNAEALSIALGVNHGWKANWPGLLDDRLRVLEERLALARRTSDKWSESQSLLYLAATHLDAGHVQRVRECLADADLLARVLRMPELSAMYAYRRAGFALVLGDLPAARAHTREGFEIGQRALGELNLQVWSVLTTLRARFQGRLDATRAGARAGAAQFPQALAWRAHLALILAELGEHDKAHAELDWLMSRDLEAVGAANNRPMNLALMADTCTALRNTGRAAEIEALVAPYGRQMLSWQGLGVYGCALRMAGNLAALQEHYDEAFERFEAAAAFEAGMEAIAWLVRSWIDHARARLDRGAPGDRDRALALLADALSESRRLGLHGWTQMALAEKLRAQGVRGGSAALTLDAVAVAVGERQVDFTGDAASDGTVTILFSDMEGFTEMTGRLGDHSAREVIRRHNTIVREQLRIHGGREVELQGDGFLLAFSDARRALACAVALQRAFRAHSEQHPEQPIRIRIGAHTGPILRDAEKFFGLTVILAARIAAQAHGGEILASAALMDHVAQAGGFHFDETREVMLKGIAAPQRIARVAW